MKNDIETPDDIKLLVDSFYSKVKNDEKIGYIFNDVAKVNWEVHLPRMYSFWETVLLAKVSFKGNPVVKHVLLNAITPLTEAHFAQWILLWYKTVDELFSGKIAQNAKSKAELMRDLMLYKIKESAHTIPVV